MFTTFPITASSLRAFAVSASVASLTGCLFASPPKDLDVARSKMSAQSQYRVSVVPTVDPVPRNSLHTWRLHLETANGAPVDSVTVAVDGGMPQHGHGLPTKPRVTRHLGNGDHLVEGMKFNMGGWWVIKFRINGKAASDSVVFNLVL